MWALWVMQLNHKTPLLIDVGGFAIAYCIGQVLQISSSKDNTITLSKEYNIPKVICLVLVKYSI